VRTVPSRLCPFRAVGLTILIVVALVAPVRAVATEAGHGQSAISRATAVCGDFPNQAATQRAHNTRDADGDGIYCESLACPCLTEKSGSGGSAPLPGIGAGANPPGCTRPPSVQNISFSATMYPNIRRHFLDALRKGWPRTLVVNRRGADARRERLLAGYPTRATLDRDEYPPSVGRGRGPGLERGTNPRGWQADVRYVPSGENRSHGATLGIKLRRLCNGARFRYVFY
jgi:hypothetical protein